MCARRSTRSRRPRRNGRPSRPSGAAILESAAAQLESRSAELIAELVREEGKTAAEATMEVRRTPANVRFYAHAVHDELVERVVAKAEALRVGPGSESGFKKQAGASMMEFYTLEKTVYLNPVL
jgi:delta 1-pyrroline-5-carboxylate dehydrogenase